MCRKTFWNSFLNMSFIVSQWMGLEGWNCTGGEHNYKRWFFVIMLSEGESIGIIGTSSTQFVSTPTSTLFHP